MQLKFAEEIFSKPEKELTRSEYFRLVETAEREQNLVRILRGYCNKQGIVSGMIFRTKMESPWIVLIYGKR